MSDVQCFGCGAPVPEATGPVHAYMLAAPGCWSLYGTLLAWRSSLPGSPGVTTSQYMVDAYAAQHATNPDRRNRQAVAGHLMSLCASLEHDVPGIRLRHLIGEWTHREYPLLVPRPATYAVTVRDVAAASQEPRSEVIADWAAATWSAWSAHHAQVRAWLDEAMASAYATTRRRPQ
jgi:hypothetical protein